MKKMMRMAAIFAAMATLLTGCGGDDDDKGKTAGAPAIALIGANIDQTQEITSSMTVKVAVTAAKGIADFAIGIESPALTADLLEDVGLAAQMNLVTPANEEMGKALSGLGFPVGAAVKGAKELSFDLSKLIPMITLIYSKTSDHKFTLTVTDAANRRTVKTLTFHLTGKSSITYNNDADLWANTASLTVALAEPASDVVVEYKRETADEWQQATVTAKADGNYTATIAPAWVAAEKHASGAEQFALNNETGVFAGATYNCRIKVGNTVVEGAEASFTTAAGTTIPNGDMNTWAKYDGYSAEGNSSKVDYPNAAATDAFWSNGNNAMVPSLCTPLVVSGTDQCAKLKGNIAFSTVFAAGNLFSGKFDMAGVSGSANFGQKYQFTARPSAFKVRYKATVGKIEKENPDPEMVLPDQMKKGQTDPVRIFACITNWTKRHSVNSGLGVKIDEINGFDPVSDAKTAEGAIIAYTSKTITETVGEWTELTLPILYLDKAGKPAAENYSLVISCASSAYGDYLCGGEKNELCVENFEWVY